MASCALNPISPHTGSCEYCINNGEEAKDRAWPARMCEDHNKPAADCVLRIVLPSPTPFPPTGRAAAKNIAMGWVIWFHFEKYTFLHALWEAHVSIVVGVVCYLGHNRTRRNSLCVNAREGFLMNCSVIEIERVFSLWNEGVTISASFSERGVSSLVRWAIKKQRDSLSKHIWSRIWGYSCWEITGKSVHWSWGWRIHEFIHTRQRACSPARGPTHSPGQPSWKQRMLYGLWLCWVPASHAPQHFILFQRAHIKK